MKHKRAESGYILVTVAALLVVLLGFTALAVDVGMLYASRTQSQRAADAGALAGAFTFILDGNMGDQPGRAILNAKKVAIQNATMGTAITDAEVSVAVDLANRKVTVDIARSEPTFFAKVLNVNSVNVGVRAIAEAAEHATNASCVKPIFIPNTIGAPNGVALCTACGAGQTLVDANHEPTTFSDGLLGTQLTLRPGGAQGAIAPGQFYSVQMGGTGGSVYRAAIQTCSAVQYQCGTSYPVETGAMIGPTRQGVEGGPGQTPGLVTTPPDTWQALHEYLHGGVQPPFDTSQQLVLAPIADLCGYCPAGNFPSGSNVNLTIVGFAMMFVDGMSNGGGPGQNDVLAHLVDVKGCGPGGGGGVDPVGSAVFATPLRLVHN